MGKREINLNREVPHLIHDHFFKSLILYFRSLEENTNSNIRPFLPLFLYSLRNMEKLKKIFILFYIFKFWSKFSFWKIKSLFFFSDVCVAVALNSEKSGLISELRWDRNKVLARLQTHVQIFEKNKCSILKENKTNKKKW